MPESFTRCVSSGGRVRTISGPRKQFGLSSGQFMRVCFKDGKMFRGEKKVNQKKKELER